MGHCYNGGRGVEENKEEAVRLFTLAANQGLADAQCDLGER
jgi:TPR repeat protein